MARFLVTLTDRSTEAVSGADAYLQEGQMTTFFRTPEARNVVDSWSTRLFSVRTSEILMIRREDEGQNPAAAAAADPARRSVRSMSPLQTLRPPA